MPYQVSELQAILLVRELRNVNGFKAELMWTCIDLSPDHITWRKGCYQTQHHCGKYSADMWTTKCSPTSTSKGTSGANNDTSEIIALLPIPPLQNIINELPHFRRSKHHITHWMYELKPIQQQYQLNKLMEYVNKVLPSTITLFEKRE